MQGMSLTINFNDFHELSAFAAKLTGPASHEIHITGEKVNTAAIGKTHTGAIAAGHAEHKAHTQQHHAPQHNGHGSQHQGAGEAITHEKIAGRMGERMKAGEVGAEQLKGLLSRYNVKKVPELKAEVLNTFWFELENL